MAGDIHDTTRLSHLSLAGTLSSGSVSITSLGRTTFGSNSSIFFTDSSTTVNFQNAVLSIRTVGNLASLASIAPTDPNNGILAVWQGASGLSLVLRSGNTIYTIGASAVSAAAP